MMPVIYRAYRSLLGIQVTLHYDARRGNIVMPPGRLELMSIRLQMEQQQQLGAVAAAVLIRRRNGWTYAWAAARL